MQAGQTLICNYNDLANILRVCEMKDLITVMRFQSPLVYFVFVLIVYRFSVLLFCLRKKIFWNSITFFNPGCPSSVL